MGIYCDFNTAAPRKNSSLVEKEQLKAQLLLNIRSCLSYLLPRGTFRGDKFYVGNIQGDLLKYEVSNLYSRDQITVAKGQNLKLGTVVAIDKDSMVKIINPTATDGTQTAIGVIASDVNAKENSKGVIIARGAMLADHAVVWPVNITEEQKTAAIKQLETRGIIIRKTV